MKADEIRYREMMDEVLSWSSDRIYNVFGAHLEKIVLDKKDKYVQRLKTIWRMRRHFAWHDTGEQLTDECMLILFDPKKLKKYSLFDLEDILDKINKEIIYSNPKPPQNDL